MLDEREVREHPAPGAAQIVAAPADDPEDQQHAEGDDGRHDLVLGQRRGEDADSQERRAHQQEPQIAGAERAPLDAREVEDEQRVDERER